ncbi:MAG: threonine/serine exporter family protein [Bulleidia sp.]
MQAVYAFLASLGFAVLFNVPENRLFYAGIAGGIGGVAYSFCHMAGISEPASLFIASFCLSLASEILARILKCPSTMFLISALIPFVPGGAAYYTVFYIIEKEYERSLMYGLSTITQAGAIVLGCVIITSIFSMIRAFDIHFHQK